MDIRKFVVKKSATIASNTSGKTERTEDGGKGDGQGRGKKIKLDGDGDEGREKKDAVTPKKAGTPKKDVTPKKKETTPKKADATAPKKKETTPKKAGATPNKETAVTPKKKEATPKKKDVMPKKKDPEPIDDDDDDDVFIVDDSDEQHRQQRRQQKKTPTPSKKRPLATEDVDDDDDGFVVYNGAGSSKSNAPAEAASKPISKAAKKEDKEVKPKSKWRPNAERPVPAMLGMKEIPEGKPYCLYGKVFLITGVLDSIDREEAETLIKKYGGEVAKSVVKKLTHAVVGNGPGESKIKKIEEAKVPQINEDGLFDLIRNEPQRKPPKAFLEKQAKQERIAQEGKAPAPAVVEAIKAVPSSHAAPIPVPVQVASAPSSKVVAARAAGDLGKQMWTTKYAPQSSDQLLANKGAIKKVQDWLKAFPSKKVSDKSFHRAVLISGVPGIGKSTTAALLAREAGYEVLEYNASDARSRKRLQEEGFMEIGGNRTMGEFFASDAAEKKHQKKKKTLIIMDEVDGMSSGDRGGNQELCQLIKKTHVPIICICNDRQKNSVKTLANYCLDVRFNRPNPDEIVGRLKIIMENEGFKHVDVQALKMLCTSVNNDIRQLLNLLQMLRLTTDRLEGQKDSFQASMAQGRHIELSPFSVVPTLFSSAAAGNRSVNDTLDLFFHDHDLMPLFVQENYINAVPAQPPDRVMNAMANAADCISFGDLVKDQVLKQQDWSLLPFLGMISTVIPSAYTRGRSGAINFPSWLGKNSNANKQKRLLKDVQVHMSASTGASDKNEIRLDYLPHLVQPLLEPLLKEGKDGVPKLMELMDSYGLTKDDWETVFVLAGKEALIEGLPSQTKSAFTRAYNKAKHSSVSGGGVKKGSGGISRVADDDLGLLDEDLIAEVEDGEGQEDADGDDEDAAADLGKNDPLIKQKTKKKGAAAGASVAGTKKPAAKKAKVSK